MVQFATDNGTPYFAPGAEGQWHYSNTGYVMLGMIIEQITGQTIGDLMQTRIFDPLGMESAVFLEGVPQPGQITTQGYFWTEDGERVNTTNWNASQGWAAGAAAMTAADLATYGQALAAGELFQNADTLNEMLTFYPAAEFQRWRPLWTGADRLRRRRDRVGPRRPDAWLPVALVCGPGEGYRGRWPD